MSEMKVYAFYWVTGEFIGAYECEKRTDEFGSMFHWLAERITDEDSWMLGYEYREGYVDMIFPYEPEASWLYVECDAL